MYFNMNVSPIGNPRGTSRIGLDAAASKARKDTEYNQAAEPLQAKWASTLLFTYLEDQSRLDSPDREAHNGRSKLINFCKSELLSILRILRLHHWRNTRLQTPLIYKDLSVPQHDIGKGNTHWPKS
jgi:hypothetical protein